MGGHLGYNLKVMEPYSKPYLIIINFYLLVFYLNIFIILATVPTALQTCAKVLQMHLSGGEGTPWMQPKSDVTFNLPQIKC